LTQWTQRDAPTREEALWYWKERHAPLVEQVPGVAHYVQNHCISSPEGVEPPYAGLGEVWFESDEAAASALAPDEWKAVLEDAASSMDLEHVSAACASEHVVR
jgi:uncharacterized protein (TIGR02118 family)